MAKAAVDAAIPSQLVIEGFWCNNFMPIKEAKAGADAIKIPTLLKSKLLIAIRKKIFATTSNVPESSAYLA